MRWIVMLLLMVGAPVLAQQNSLPAAADARTEQRVALVIGNSAYKDSPLRNPSNDASDMAQTLRGLGFHVILRTNAGRRQMVEAVREFGNQIKRGGVGLFYYAGHGVQSRGKNFLIPVDAHIEGEADLEFETMDANMVLAQMDDAGNRVNIVVLDACRDNPFARSFRSASRGLAQLDAARGSFLAYATAPGSVASDGDGRNGIYTKHLLASLRNPDSKLEEVFKRVRVEVARETGNRQIPWDSSSVLGDFHFAGTSQVAAATTSAPPIAIPQGINPLTIELAYWDSIRNSTSADDYAAYLERYPDGQFSNLAKNRMAAELKKRAGERAAPAGGAEKAAEDPGPPSQVVIYRKSAFIGMSIELHVSVDGRFIGNLASGTYFNLNLPPGTHQISVAKKSGALLRGTCNQTLSVASGEKYFLETDTGDWGNITNCGLSRTNESVGPSEITGLARRN